MKAPIRVALVGCGGMGYYHAQQLVEISDLRVVALCDIVKGRFRRFLKDSN